MAPSTPYAAEELWERLGNPFSVHLQPWPQFDPALTREDLVEVAVQVNGKIRDRLHLAPDAPEAEAIAQARASERVREWLQDKEPVKVIYVPGRILNIVVRG